MLGLTQVTQKRNSYKFHCSHVFLARPTVHPEGSELVEKKGRELKTMAHVNDTKRGHNNCEDLELITSASDTVSILVESIQKDLREVPSLPYNCSIYRVPKPLLEIKPEAYTPRMISIGPFHRYKEHLQPMEAHKLRYLNDLLGRESPATLGDYVKVMKELEDQARQCYSEIIQLKSEDDFVKMMLLDGCFIVELILRTDPQERRYQNDPILNAIWMSHAIKCDLILLENQLPFFVLECLYDLFKGNSYSSTLDHPLTFSNSVRRLLRDFAPHPQTITPKSSRLQRVSEVAKIVFDFVSVTRWPGKKDVMQRRLNLAKSEDVRSKLFHGSVVNTNDKEIVIGESSEGNCKAKHLLDFIRDLLLQSSSRGPEHCGEFMRTRCATELHKASVKFEKGQTTCLLDITFINGVLVIPTMEIEDWTESLLRNLIAYEQSHDDCPNDITAYAVFIDGLIDSPKDVELLQGKGIIENLLGEPVEVATLYNNLVKEVTITHNNFYFSGVSSEVEKYYKIPWHKWKANLMLNYFNTPWALISFLAAVFALVLTVVQTVCSLLAI